MKSRILSLVLPTLALACCSLQGVAAAPPPAPKLPPLCERVARLHRLEVPGIARGTTVGCDEYIGIYCPPVAETVHTSYPCGTGGIPRSYECTYYVLDTSCLRDHCFTLGTPCPIEYCIQDYEAKHIVLRNAALAEFDACANGLGSCEQKKACMDDVCAKYQTEFNNLIYGTGMTYQSFCDCFVASTQ